MLHILLSASACVISMAHICSVVKTFSHKRYIHITIVLTMFSSYITASQILLSTDFDEGSGPIFLDQLRCSGSEQSLLECPSGRGIGLHRCTHVMDVGLHCSGIFIYTCTLYFSSIGYSLKLCSMPCIEACD